MSEADDLETDALALELVLELAEPALGVLPASDRQAVVAACLRVRRIALQLRAGVAVPPPRGGPTPWTRN